MANYNVVVPMGLVAIMAFLYLRKNAAPIVVPPPPPDAPDPVPPHDLKEDRRIIKNTHLITVNNSVNQYRHVFPTVLRNVVNVELVQAIIPLSSYRINATNDAFPIVIAGTPATLLIEHGVYDNISVLLIAINALIRAYVDTLAPPAGSYFFLVFDALTRAVHAIATQGLGAISIPFASTANTCHRFIGFAKEDVDVDATTAPRADAYLDTSIGFQTATIANEVYINNLPTSYYSGLSMFPATVAGLSLHFATSANRVNISHQMYVDVNVKEINYWDGTNRLAQIYIPENNSIGFYARQYQIHRRMKTGALNLDHLTFEFRAVSSTTESDLYDFHGISYSLELEITTEDHVF